MLEDLIKKLNKALEQLKSKLLGRSSVDDEDEYDDEEYDEEDDSTGIHEIDEDLIAENTEVNTLDNDEYDEDEEELSEEEEAKAKKSKLIKIVAAVIIVFLVFESMFESDDEPVVSETPPPTRQPIERAEPEETFEEPVISDSSPMEDFQQEEVVYEETIPDDDFELAVDEPEVEDFDFSEIEPTQDIAHEQPSEEFDWGAFGEASGEQEEVIEDPTSQDPPSTTIDDLFARIQEQEEQSPEYVEPPRYDRLGRGLVYNCSERHWACVNRESYFDCTYNKEYHDQVGSKKECYPVAVYATEEDCRIVQLYNINTHEDTSFCD